jgi:type IV pilus assembly protein PilW
MLMSGFGLAEMMISLTIGLLIIAALFGVVISSSNNSKTNDRTSELQSNGRFALDHLARELRHAGNRGYTAALPDSAAWVTPIIANECGTAGSFVKNIRQGVWASNNSNPFAANCISGGSAAQTYKQGDVLVIRRAASTPTLQVNAIANASYLRSSYLTETAMQGSALPAGTTVGTEIFALQNYVYYIGGDDADSTIPALRRVTLANNAMVDELVVSGIEQIEVEFGVTQTANSRYFLADDINGGHSATGPTDWDNINAVRIWLLARNAKTEAGYTNTNTYNLSDQTYGPFNDNFRRQIFTGVVQLRNFRDF